MQVICAVGENKFGAIKCIFLSDIAILRFPLRFANILNSDKERYLYKQEYRKEAMNQYAKPQRSSDVHQKLLCVFMYQYHFR